MNEIIAILDASGSMEPLREQTISSFKEFLDGQENVKVTVTAFNSNVYTLYDCEDKEQIDISINYRTHGLTALYDAIGTTFYNVGKRLDQSETKPEKVMVVIITDGMDNSSAEYNANSIKEIIEHQRTKYSWEVIFLGANIDADEVAGQLGIQYSANYSANNWGTQSAYTSVAKASRGFLDNGVILDGWDKDIE